MLGLVGIIWQSSSNPLVQVSVPRYPHPMAALQPVRHAPQLLHTTAAPQPSNFPVPAHTPQAWAQHSRQACSAHTGDTLAVPSDGGIEFLIPTEHVLQKASPSILGEVAASLNTDKHRIRQNEETEEYVPN